MTNLVNSGGRSILPPCWTRWYFSNHPPGEHAWAMLVIGPPFPFRFCLCLAAARGRRIATERMRLSNLIAASDATYLLGASLRLHAERARAGPLLARCLRIKLRAAEAGPLGLGAHVPKGGGKPRVLGEPHSLQCPETENRVERKRGWRGYSAAHPWVGGGKNTVQVSDARGRPPNRGLPKRCAGICGGRWACGLRDWIFGVTPNSHDCVKIF